MAASKSGLNTEQRERFLLDHGFAPLRAGKGSHQQWEHAELKLLARSHNISPPANLLSNSAQKPWEITVNDDPAKGTWLSISKYAVWCQKKTAEIKSASAHQRQRCDFLRQFHKAATDIRQWKKDVKHHFKAGLDADKTPKPPLAYQELLALRARKIQLSLPMG